MKKNIKVIGYILWVMVALLVSAPTMAQAEAQQPNDNQFRSTSTSCFNVIRNNVKVGFLPGDVFH